MATIVKDLGAATAYGYAVEKGYTGTEEEFAELMASYASVAESAADSASAAAQSATNASNSAAAAATSASAASASATTASTKAGEAETSAAAADGSASAAAQSATSASDSATSASVSASAAAQSATSASGSATSASGSATAAANSATAAAASEAAAREVEESIPADYSDLSADVSDLKSAYVAKGSYNTVDKQMCDFFQTAHNMFSAYTAEITNNSITPISATSFDAIFSNSNPVKIKLSGLTAGRAYVYAFTAEYSHIVRAFDSDDSTFLAGAQGTGTSAIFTPTGTTAYLWIYRDTSGNRIDSFAVFDTTDPNYISSRLSNGVYTDEPLLVGYEKRNNAVYYENLTPLTNGRAEIPLDFNEMAGYQISFYGKITTFGSGSSLYFGRGYNDAQTIRVIITPTTVRVSGGGGDVTFEHGLTFTDYISCVLDQSSAGSRCGLVLATNGGRFVKTFTDIAASGRKGKPYMYAVGTSTVFSYSKLGYYCKNWFNPIWMFGDSYFSIGDPARWTSYITSEAKENIVMMNGFPGANSADEYGAMLNALSMYTPRYIVWCMGMNDSYSDWLNYLSLVKRQCDLYGITLIPATIPNVQTRDNQDKNTYIRTNFSEYIDFQMVVNTSTDSSVWYTNMLSSDEVHPDVQGAVALFGAAASVFPCFAHNRY